jgi:hypothetical protein
MVWRSCRRTLAEAGMRGNWTLVQQYNALLVLEATERPRTKHSEVCEMISRESREGREGCEEAG